MPQVEPKPAETFDEAARLQVLSRVGRPRSSGIRRALRWGLALLVIGATVGGYFYYDSLSASESALEYVTVSVTRGDLRATVAATGSLQGRDTVQVGPEISGRVKAVHVDFNDVVKAGQLLCEIDPEQFRANRNQARAQLIAARAELKNRRATVKEARIYVDRVRAMADKDLVAPQELDTAQAAFERAEAAVESSRAQITVAKAALSSAETALAKTKIVSPIDGVVLSRAVEVGQTVVSVMQAPVLFTLARDLREMELNIAIDEADIGQTQVGQKATFTVDAYPDRSFPTEIEAIHNVAVLKDNVVTYEAKLAVSNDDLALRPGMTANVTIVTSDRDNVLLVPNMALRFSPPREGRRMMFSGPHGRGAPRDTDPRPSLWIPGEPDPTQLRVTTGLTDGTHTEIVAGDLHEGDFVITDVIEGKGKKR